MADPEIASVAIQGNSSVESSLILSRFPLNVGDRLIPALAREGIKDLFSLGLFDDVSLLSETRPDGRVDLVIRVVERKRIGSIRFSGNDHLGADELSDRIVLNKGQLYDPAAVEAARQELLTAYREEGYPLAAVSTGVEPEPDGERLALTFSIEEGERVRLRKINFLGNEAISGDDLRGAMESKPKGFLRKGRFQQDKFDGDIERITQYYHDHGYRDAEVVDYDVDYSGDARDIFVTIQVNEGPLYTLEPPT